MPSQPKKFRKSKPRTNIKTIKNVSDANRYDSRWTKVSRAYLSQHPVCYCDQIKVWDGVTIRTISLAKAGTFKPAVLTDHIKPLSMGGDCEPSNYQALCSKCHAIKTYRWG